MTPPLAVLGLSELASVLGVKPGTVRQWHHRGQLPEPDAVLACGPVWRQSTIDKWKGQQ